jgi:hypothetical protein
MPKSKLAVTAFALALATPALADPPRWAPAHGWRAKHYPHHPAPRFAVVQPSLHYCYAPRPVVVVPPPAPVYYGPSVHARIDGDLAVVGGAVIGAVIGAHLAGR